MVSAAYQPLHHLRFHVGVQSGDSRNCMSPGLPISTLWGLTCWQQRSHAQQVLTVLNGKKKQLSD